MAQSLKIIIAQLNLHVGDLNKNLAAHIAAAVQARDQHHADLIVFPELSLTGYPPEDLLLRRSFIAECKQALEQFMQTVTGIHCLIGHPEADGEKLYNACSLVHDGSILGTYRKFHLPNYGVFDEQRYFDPEDKACVININGTPTGIIICEDVWSKGPLEKSIAAGAKLVVIPNASPFVTDKHEQRVNLLSQQAKEHHTPLIYVNNIGGQDELVFDGGSMVIDHEGKMTHFCGFFNEILMPVEISLDSQQPFIAPQPLTPVPLELERIYQALVLGTKDYISKNNFPGVLIGLSGGIDSALTAAIAVDALGKDNVHGVFMPSRYTSTLSGTEAKSLAELLDIKLSNLSIDDTYQQFITILSVEFQHAQPEITEQNIQSRCRCILLMALSNSSGKLVLTTGNRSELAVGYCTLYGDMSGGYAPIKNIPKTMVYQLAKWRNQKSAAIPIKTIEREPTAELAPNQKDEDSLPPYSVLDPILEAYLNHGHSIAEIVAEGFDVSVVKKVVTLIHRNEYKRKQYAVGPQIQHTSFIKDWRYPITNGYKN